MVDEESEALWVLMAEVFGSAKSSRYERYERCERYAYALQWQARLRKAELAQLIARHRRLVEQLSGEDERVAELASERDARRVVLKRLVDVAERAKREAARELASLSRVRHGHGEDELKGLRGAEVSREQMDVVFAAYEGIGEDR
jgi:LPS O-antigen subunit length determinant protein (WzzB/FepE family)